MLSGTARARGSSLFLMLLASCGEPASQGPWVSATEAAPAPERAPEPAPEPASASASEAQTAEVTPCGTEKVARFIGTSAAPATRKDIESLAGRAPVRWITPGQPITLDFSEARLNVIVDEQGKIAAMRCG
jgi:hypothetical protein